MKTYLKGTLFFVVWFSEWIEDILGIFNHLIRHGHWQKLTPIPGGWYCIECAKEKWRVDS